MKERIKKKFTIKMFQFVSNGVCYVFKKKKQIHRLEEEKLKGKTENSHDDVPRSSLKCL